MKKLFFYTLFCCYSFLLPLHSFSQIQELELEPWSDMSRLYIPQQEKLYLHFDKPYYAAGENMWFRAYLLDASALTKDTLCNALYVELINSRDSLIYRKKINRINSIFSGYFKLHELLSEGSYWIRAYTNNMRNAGESFFFKRPFFIGNNLSSEIRTKASYKFISEKLAYIEISFERKKEKMTLEEVGYRLNYFKKGKQKLKRRKNTQTTYQGILRYEYNPKKLYYKKPSITVFYDDSINHYERTFLLPVKNEFSVKIFPEGGEIIQGTTNCIAFKAIKTDGLSIPVEGKLYDHEDKEITSFKSTHLGMGKFCFFAEKFKRYYIVFKNENGEKQHIQIPRHKKDGYALSAVVKYGRILVHVKSQYSKEINDSLVLIGHMGGTVFYSDYISGVNPAVVFNIKDLHPGIAHFILLDKEGNPISERLAFVRPEESTSVEVDFSKLVHEKRRPVHCMLIAKDSKGNPIEDGSFSVAVTDAKAVELNPENDNIMSNLLLNSDIKGYVEKPGSYFDPNNKNAEQDIDLLLMTQGWRRFKIKNVLHGNPKEKRFEVENGIDISGQLMIDKKNPAQDVQILTYSPYILYFDETKTDSLGRFTFKNLRFPNNNQFNLYARNDIPFKKNPIFIFDEQEFPDIDDNIFPENAPPEVTDEYMEVTNEKFFNENGTRNVYTRRHGLVAITPQENITRSKNEDISYSNEEYILEGYLLDKKEEIYLADLLRELPGMENWNTMLQPKTPYNNTPQNEIISGPRFAIDGNIYSYNELSKVKLDDLESIRILQKEESGQDKWRNTLVALSFKKENPISSDKHTIATTLPLGYEDNTLFYEPDYEILSERFNPIADWRSTITFIPEIRTGPTGKAYFKFYTADRVSPYNIEIEGISSKGEPCRFTTKKMLLFVDKQYQIK